MILKAAGEIKVKHAGHPRELSVLFTRLTMFVSPVVMIQKIEEYNNIKAILFILCSFLASPREYYWGCVLAWLMLID